MMMKKILVYVGFGLLFVSPLCLATEEEMKNTLVQIIQQLEAIKPLINQAEKEQPKDTRIKVQFNAYTDSEGTQHPGLNQDIESIQQSLIAIVNQQGLDELNIEPVNNDFTG